MPLAGRCVTVRPLLALLIALLSPAAATAAPFPVSGPDGGAFTVTSNGSRVLVTYIHRGSDRGTIFARMLDGNGRPAGPARAVGTTKLGFGLTMPPAVVWSPARKQFIIAFQATGPSELSVACGPPATAGPYGLAGGCMQSDTEIYTRVLDRTGRPKGTARRVTSTGRPSELLLTATRPGLALDPRSDRALLTFTAVIGTTGGATRILRAQRLDATGAAIGGPVRIGPGAEGLGVTGRPRPNRNGGWDVVYEGTGKTDLGGHVLSQRVSPSGRLTGRPATVLEAVGGGQSPGLALQTDPRTGRTLGLWQRSAGFAPGQMTARVLGPTGRPAAGTQALPKTASWRDIAAAPTRTGWALLLTSYVPGGEVDLFLSRLDDTGRLRDASTRLTHYAPAAGTPSGTYSFKAVLHTGIAALDDGRLVGVWIEQLRGPGPRTAPAEIVAARVG